MIDQNHPHGIEFSLWVDIRPDESLNGYFSRMAARMALPDGYSVIEAAGSAAPSLLSFHKFGTDEDKVARACRLPVKEIRKRRHIAFGERADLVHIGDERLSAHLVRTNSVWIAPATLAEIGHHRLEWAFKFLTFDPQTGETLIDRCACCGTELSWSRPSFLICSSCGTPLAAKNPHFATQDERLVASTFADILALDPARRAKARARLAPEIRALPAEDIFRFLFEISGLFEFKKYRKRDRPTEIGWASVLLRAYQIATEWPEAFLALLEAIRLDASERPGRFGLRKEFGDLGALLRAWDHSAEIRAVVFPILRDYLSLHPKIALKAKTRFAEQIDESSRYVTLKDIQHKYGWSHRMANRLLRIPGVVVGTAGGSGAPLQIDRRKVAEIYDDFKTFISRRTIRAVWKLPHEAIVQITEAGIFLPVTDLHAELLENVDGLFRRHQVADVIDRAHACLTVDGSEAPTISFNRIVSELGREVQKPWPIVLQAVLDGKLKPVKISQKDKGGFGRIRFRQEDANRWIASKTGQGEKTLSLLEASKCLQMHIDSVYLLVSRGLLTVINARAGERGRRVSMLAIHKFDKEYVSSASLAARFNSRSNFLIDSLEVLGIEPIPAFSCNRRIYRRSDIPADFRPLSRTEIEAKQKALGILPTKKHAWRNYPN